MTAAPGTVTITVQALQLLITAAMVDSKTGALAYPAWRARAVETLRTSPDGPGWVVLLIDVDRFAALNTRFGHLAVDQVLMRIVVELQAAMGPAASIGRFGGDEFVILAPAPTTTDARATAESIRQAVVELVVTVDGPAGSTLVDGITVSVGTAHDRRRVVRSDPDVILTALLWGADQALYDAKRAGGNAVRSCQPA